jgi:uncharacterized protein (DUF3084 family)
VPDPDTIERRIQETVAEVDRMRAEVSTLGEKLAHAELDLKTLRTEVRTNRSEHSERLVVVEKRTTAMDASLDVLHQQVKATDELARETGKYADRVTAHIMWTADVVLLVAQQAGVTELPPKPSSPPPPARRRFGL